VNEVVVDPPPKELPVEAAKCKSAPQTLLPDAEKQNSHKPQSHHQVATAFPRKDEVHKEKLITERPEKKVKIDLPRDPHEEPVVPPKPRSRKRKVETEALDVDDLLPKKRRAPSKSRSANVGAQNPSIENDAPAEFSQALANAINSARPLAAKDKESSGHTRKKATPEAPDPDRCENVDPRPRIASKAKRKRPQAPAEGMDETLVEMVAAKKPKTTAPMKPKKDVPQLIVPHPSENRTSPHRTKPVKELTKDDHGKRSVCLFFPCPLDKGLFFFFNLRTLNPKKKRKENATAGKPIKTTSTSNVPQVHIV